MFTQLSDVIVPEVFQQYVIQRTAELSRVRQSGIIASMPGLVVPKGGLTVNMPFWNDIDGEDEVFTDSGETIPDKLTATKDVAAVITRIKSWSDHDLSAFFSGSDPLGAAAELTAAYWSRKEQKILLSILKGVFASASMSDNTMDASTQVLSNTLLIAALALLGDHGPDLTGILCHSQVLYDLAEKRLLDPKITEPGSSAAPEFQTYLGRSVVADDGIPVEGGVYTTYFFGTGAVAYAEGAMDYPVEFERKGTASIDIMINRRAFIMHPRGVKWIGSAADTTPSNTELATGTNWERVFQQKSVRIVALKHRIG